MVSRAIWVSHLPEFARELEQTERFVFRYVVELSAESVINGSALTGAPGQPADLRDADPSSGKDWQIVYGADNSAVIGNADKSARSVEDGISYRWGTALTRLHSDVGGFHSVALTHANADKIIVEVVRRVRKA